jgi:hypothetical protein
MPKEKPSQHTEILEYALSHLEAEREKIQDKIDAIRQELKGGKTVPARRNVAAVVPAAATAAPAAAPRKKRVLSEAARKRIAAAQKRRWAEHRKKKAE